MIKQNNKSEPALYLQIRRYVVGLALDNEQKQRKLPSLGKLMALFKASRPTVCKAIRSLLDEGLVISKPGIGIFTSSGNHDLELMADVERPIIVGCIVGDGRFFGLYSSFARKLGQLLTHVTEFKIWMRPLNLVSGSSPEELLQELERERLDAVIALESSDTFNMPVLGALAMLKERGLKVVTGEVIRPEFTSVSMNYVTMGRLIGREMLARNENSIFFFPNMDPWTTELDGIRQVFRDAGKTLDERYFIKESDRKVNIGQILVEAVRENPDLHFVCIKITPPYNLEKYLAEHAPDLFEKCIFVYEKDDIASEGTRMKILGIKCPEEQYAMTILQEVRRQLDGDDTIRRITMPEEAFQVSYREC